MENIEKIRQEERQVAHRPINYRKWEYYPEELEDEDGYRDYGYDKGVCPNCDMPLDAWNHRGYCGYCGQKILWDEDYHC